MYVLKDRLRELISNSKALRASELFRGVTFSTSAYVTIMDDSFEKHLKVFNNILYHVHYIITLQ